MKIHPYGPEPETKGEAVTLALVGLVALVVVIALVVWR